MIVYRYRLHDTVILIIHVLVLRILAALYLVPEWSE